MNKTNYHISLKQEYGRLYNLDYLRGLAAFGIMIYHYLSWSLNRFTADSFMGRIGVYGVSIFYILSGLTLYYVYYERFKPSLPDLKLFFRRRVFRILPLLWLVTILALLLAARIPDFVDLFLNLTGLFGFVRWDKYFSPGVWSIGNELVFYAFFPFFILFTKQAKPLMILLAVTILASYLYFSFFKLDPTFSLEEQWSSYINPLNQVFLFLGGFLIGLFFHKLQIKNSIVVVLLLTGLILFVLYPVTGNTIHLVTGTNRLIFTACSFLICFCFYKLTFKFPKIIHKPLTLLGEASYSVYLLHPIIWTLTGIVSKYLSQYLFNIPASLRLLSSLVLTLIISYYVYQYFEKYFMKFGRTNNRNLKISTIIQS